MSRATLITGGSGGFGKATAIALARDGAAVTLMGRSEPSLEAARELVADESGSSKMANGGSFVFISSTAAVMPFKGLTSYCAAKAGVDQFMKVSALELAQHNIRVNCVRPGLCRTDGMDWAFSDQAYLDSL